MGYERILTFFKNEYVKGKKILDYLSEKWEIGRFLYNDEQLGLVYRHTNTIIINATWDEDVSDEFILACSLYYIKYMDETVIPKYILDIKQAGQLEDYLIFAYILLSLLDMKDKIPTNLIDIIATTELPVGVNRMIEKQKDY